MDTLYVCMYSMLVCTQVYVCMYVWPSQRCGIRARTGRYLSTAYPSVQLRKYSLIVHYYVMYSMYVCMYMHLPAGRWIHIPMTVQPFQPLCHIHIIIVKTLQTYIHTYIHTLLFWNSFLTVRVREAFLHWVCSQRNCVGPTASHSQKLPAVQTCRKCMYVCMYVCIT